MRDWRGKRNRSQLSGLHLALDLEAYGRLCSHNLSERENYESSDGHAGSQANLVPHLPEYAGNLDWMALGIATTLDALQFRVDIEQANERVTSIADYQDGEDALAEALHRTAALGVKAFELAAVMMRRSGIPHSNHQSGRRSRVYLEERIAVYQEREAASTAAQLEFHSKLMASPSIID